MDLSTFDHCLWGKFFIPIWEIPEVKTLLFHSVNEMTGKAYFCLFLQIWTLAMTQHNKYGELLFSVGTEKYAMKEKDIAREIGTDLTFLMDALDALLKLELVKKDGDIYYVPLAPKSFNYEALLKGREGSRLRQQKHRKKVQSEESVTRDVTRDVTCDVTHYVTYENKNKSKSKNKNKIVTTPSQTFYNKNNNIKNFDTLNNKGEASENMKILNAAFAELKISLPIRNEVYGKYPVPKILECIEKIKSTKKQGDNVDEMLINMLKEDLNFLRG